MAPPTASKPRPSRRHPSPRRPPRAPGPACLRIQAVFRRAPSAAQSSAPARPRAAPRTRSFESDRLRSSSSSRPTRRPSWRVRRADARPGRGRRAGHRRASASRRRSSALQQARPRASPRTRSPGSRSRPAASARRCSSTIRPLRSSGLLTRFGIHSSPYATTRSSTFSPSPPTSTGGCGFCTGFGQHQIGSKSTMRPWYSASSWVQIAFMASTLSRMRRKRVSGSVPWFSISSRFQPAPTPNRKRPPEMWSSVATSFAVTIGSRSITRQTPVPSFSRSVRAPRPRQRHERIERVAVLARQLAAARVGRVPAHRDVRVLRRNSDSKPRSSTARRARAGCIP